MADLRLGTRGSELALFQANAVAALLARDASVTCEIVVIRTSGDRLADAPLSEIGGKRLFVKEIEDALLCGDIDLAVHSSKDMPAVLPHGLAVGAVLPREDPHDAFVLPDAASAGLSMHETLSELRHQPRIGTSSVRRVAQLRRLIPEARFLPVRGNLGTRLRKLDAGEYDALVLAAAGLRRLGRVDRITALLPPEVCLPAPGQGIIAVEVREDDERVRGHVRRIDDSHASVALAAERAVVTRLGGGCQMPIGALARLHDTTLEVHGVVIAPDGRRSIRASATGAVGDAERLGSDVADHLLRDGAGDILATVRAASVSVEGIQP